jgi:hypothetical protein
VSEQPNQKQSITKWLVNKFTTFSGDETNVDKLQQLLDSFDTLKDNKVFRSSIQAWVNVVISEENIPCSPSPALHHLAAGAGLQFLA